MGEAAEGFRAGYEVGLAVDFHHHTHSTIAMRIQLNRAFGGHAVGTLIGGRLGFLAQVIHGFDRNRR